MREIPKIPKEDLEQIEVGYHNVPNWLLYLLGFTVIAGLSAYILN